MHTHLPSPLFTRRAVASAGRAMAAASPLATRTALCTCTTSTPRSPSRRRTTKRCASLSKCTRYRVWSSCQLVTGCALGVVEFSSFNPSFIVFASGRFGSALVRSCSCCVDTGACRRDGRRSRRARSRARAHRHLGRAVKWARRSCACAFAIHELKQHIFKPSGRAGAATRCVRRHCAPSPHSLCSSVSPLHSVNYAHKLSLYTLSSLILSTESPAVSTSRPKAKRACVILCCNEEE